VIDSGIVDQVADLIERLGWQVDSMTDVGAGRGVFSAVVRVEISGGPASSIVVKVPDPGPNGAAARAMGAYEREALVYATLLDDGPPAHPVCHLVSRDDERGAAFVLEDLSPHRAVDQGDGLDVEDARLVIHQLAALHHRFAPSARVLPVRHSTPTGFESTALERGLEAAADYVEGPTLRVLHRMVERHDRLVTAFATASGATLCHGDPRADNVAFGPQGAILFDWQQVAIQLGEADVAWLHATSLTVETRRRHERQLVADYQDLTRCDGFDRYRLGMVLPGFAVLLLAQRQASDPRTAAFIATSVQRIAQALEDLEVDDLAR
jgi:hypothetical protein